MMVGLVFGMQGAGLVVGPLIASGLLATNLDHDTIWRILLGIGAIPGLAVYYLRRRIQETPRWAALHGDTGETHDAVDNVRGGPTQRTEQPQEERTQPSEQDSVLGGYEDLAGNPRLRKWLFGTSAAWFLMDFAYYGNTISSPAVIGAINSKASLLQQTLTQLGIFVLSPCPAMRSRHGYWIASAARRFRSRDSS